MPVIAMRWYRRRITIGQEIGRVVVVDGKPLVAVAKERHATRLGQPAICTITHLRLISSSLPNITPRLANHTIGSPHPSPSAAIVSPRTT
jgi:hypothetical protein